MQVIGLDLSLTSTGLADARAMLTWQLQPGKRRGYERLRWLRQEILAHCSEAHLVVVEGPSYGNQGQGRQGGHHERAGLWWFVTEALEAADIPMVVVAPAALKKYATGKGNAAKDEVLLAAAKRFNWFAGNNDQADAAWLSALGYDLGNDPAVVMPQKHRDALDNVEWLTAA